MRDKLLSQPSFRFEKNVFFQTGLSEKKSFEEKYIHLRKREQRVYSDEIVRSLPDFNEAGTLQEEWAIRKFTSKNLIKYFQKKEEKLSILELGCGNGWLSHQLAASLNAEILGVDVNETELLQGAKLFNDYHNLSFMHADIFSDDFKAETFDAIVLASSIQYFQDLNKLLSRLLELTKSTGEIHIVDSPIYTSVRESLRAQKRSRDYFISQGVPEMTDSYFHHHDEALKTFNPQFRFKPNSLISVLKRKFLQLPQPSFPWIIIKHP